jgi:hypothetical protein
LSITPSSSRKSIASWMIARFLSVCILTLCLLQPLSATSSFDCIDFNWSQYNSFNPTSKTKKSPLNSKSPIIQSQFMTIKITSNIVFEIYQIQDITR